MILPILAALTLQGSCDSVRVARTEAALRVEASRPSNLAPRRMVVRTLADSLAAACRNSQPPPPPTNVKPRASFAATVANGIVTFDGSSSVDDHGIVFYTWRTDNATRPEKTGAVMTRTCSATSPAWTERLIVADAAGLTDSTSKLISCGTAAPPTPPPPVDTTPPPPIPPPSGSDIQKILTLIGPTKTVTETALLGAPFTTYDALFNQYFPIINAATNANRFDNYYDRAKAYYARYARTGDVKFRSLADSIALAYRRSSIVPSTQPHNSQVIGLEVHYRLTGDTLSRRAVAGLYAHSLSSYTVAWQPGQVLADIANTQVPYMENRIQARALQGALSSYRMGASYRRPDGVNYPASAWPTTLRDILTKILSTQNANGSWSWVQVCGGQLNYMVGMLNDVLIDYYLTFEPDARIPGAVEKANEYLWTTQWLPASKSFNYASVNCNPNPFGTNVGGLGPAGDLNGLFIASFGWLAQRTGDPKWRTRGDEIMAGLVLPVWAGSYGSSKQFNQMASEAYRYLGWR